MVEFCVGNVNEALPRALRYMIEQGVRESTRNGDVLVAPEPVMTVYRKPCERVLFSPIRDANPFFHLMEALWMLAGRNDLEFPKYFNKRFENFSDDGVTVHGAYGHRWRKWFGYDQVTDIIKELSNSSTSRRAVMTMWAPQGDLRGFVDPYSREVTGGLTGRDVPCNTHAYFDCRGGKLNMTVCCRSNDLIWGAYGANVVHFSVLQEYIATAVGVEVGVYRQFSNNFHLYTDLYGYDYDTLQREDTNLYSKGRVRRKLPTKLIQGGSVEKWDEDLQKFLETYKTPATVVNYHDSFFSTTAAPMLHAWQYRKADVGTGLAQLQMMPVDSDWRHACEAWVQRREDARRVRQLLHV